MPLTSRRALGSSGIEVSRLSLGSWMTFEYLPRETGAAVLAAARASGIDFFDDARYDDHTGTGPMKTGYSEVVFGEIFRTAGLKRDEVVVANKLWWELWPRESAADEVNGSLGRMGFDYLDLVYANPPPEGLALPELVGSLGELISSGRARSWGVVNWPARLIAEAVEVAARLGAPAPCAAQLPYSLVQRSPVEDEDMMEVLGGSRIPVIASAVLAGGALTGKYASKEAKGRVANRLEEPRVRRALGPGEQLRALAERIGAKPAALAIAYTLSNPDVASVLFGATSPAQVLDNATAPALLSSLDDAQLADLRQIGL
jgi:aryl-alcohol dehydrogenase-like predicted oxidoreductase